jgi:predicted 3-demethylubiquinone-9 3-methyltransferase (glyoxalase superfamily)
MSAQAHPFLMFQRGAGREAVDLYVSLFDDGEVVSLEAYGPQGPGPEGTIMRAEIRFAGQTFYVSDSFVTHGFDFTPSLSVWVECESAQQQETLFAALSDGGGVLMPLDAYGFSARFGWLNDRYGVSWQLNLA